MKLQAGRPWPLGVTAEGTGLNVAVFSAETGALVHSMDTKQRVTQARFSPDGGLLVLSGATGQPQRKDGAWPSWGRLQAYRVEWNEVPATPAGTSA